MRKALSPTAKSRCPQAPSSSKTKRKVALEAARSLGLEAISVGPVPRINSHPAGAPRTAMYSTWGSTQDVGWVRYAFDQYQIPYDLIYKERVRAGNLRASYDVILIPNQGRTAKGLVFDIEPKKIPLAYTKTDKFKFLGDYGSSPDITGGMGLEGVVALQQFVKDGGVLVTMGVSSSFPPEFGLTRRVEAGRTSPQFYAPGPIVQAEITHPENPIFYGYDGKMQSVRWAGGPLLTVLPADKDDVLMRFPGGDESVLSGFMKNASEIKGRPAIVDVPVEKGRVILFATNPCYRWQNLGEFRMLFNVLMNFNHLTGRSGT